jgi:hypothetical protein
MQAVKSKHMKNDRKFFSMTFLFRSNKKSRSSVLLILTGFIPALIGLKADGRSLFEEAYRIEKTQPEQAAVLYRQAIDAGLASELNRAARWRLFFLYRSQGWYLQAYETLKTLSYKKSIEDSLLEDIQSQWGLRRQTFLNFVKVSQSFKKGKKPDSADISALRSIYGEGSNRFRADLDRWLKEQGHEAITVQLAAGERNLSEAETAIRTASYYVDRNDPGKAREALEPVLVSDQLNRSERMRILYLLGRLNRLIDGAESAAYFRMSATYASGSEWQRQMALAAFSLYRDGLSEQAAQLSMQIDAATIEDEGMRLFLDVLAADVRKDPEALARLRGREKELRRQSNSFLAERALQILERRQ